MRVLRRRLNTIAVATSVFLVVAFYYLTGGTVGDLLPAARPAVAVVADDPPGAWDQHPVVQLHHAAEGRFDALLRRQSRTPDAAAAEYARRYGRPPPAGFRRWVEYALAHGSPLVDDFDAIADGVHPLLKYSAAELARRARRALDARRGNHVELCDFADGQFGSGCRDWAAPLARLLGIPYFPITPTWPLLGPLGLVPLPSKWYIEFGEPIRTDQFEVGSSDGLVSRPLLTAILHLEPQQLPSPFRWHGPGDLASDQRELRCFCERSG